MIFLRYDHGVIEKSGDHVPPPMTDRQFVFLICWPLTDLVFLTSDSDSACRNPPPAHLQTAGAVILRVQWRFPGVWRYARGGFRHAESESEVKNDGKQAPDVKKEENRNLYVYIYIFFYFSLFFHQI